MGTLAGMVAFMLFLLMFYIGISPISIGKFVGFWVPVAAIIWVIIKVKRECFGGYLTYSQGFITGMVTVLTWASFKGFAMYIFMTVINQHVIDQYADFTSKYFDFVENISGEQFMDRTQVMEMIKELTPWKVMLADINMNVLFGSIIAFMVPVIFRKNPPSANHIG